MDQLQNVILLYLQKQTIVPRIVNEDNFCYGLIEYPSADNNFKRVLVASSLVDLSRNVIPVRIVNVGDKAKVIMEGEVLATSAAERLLTEFK